MLHASWILPTLITCCAASFSVDLHWNCGSCVNLTMLVAREGQLIIPFLPVAMQLYERAPEDPKKTSFCQKQLKP